MGNHSNFPNIVADIFKRLEFVSVALQSFGAKFKNEDFAFIVFSNDQIDGEMEDNEILKKQFISLNRFGSACDVQVRSVVFTRQRCGQETWRRQYKGAFL